jgi:mannitol-specific phosphotransferase system IIBC component
MISKQPSLITALGPQTASAFGGGSAGANVGLIQSLPANEKAVARKAFSDSLSTMWIMYVCFAVIGLGISFLITKNVLSKQHEETTTGLEAEKNRMAEREAERAEKKKKRASKSGMPVEEKV